MSDEETGRNEDDRVLTEGLVTHSSTFAGGKTQHSVDSGRNGSAGPDEAMEPDPGQNAADAGDAGDADQDAGDLAQTALANAQRIARGKPGRGGGAAKAGSAAARRRMRRQNLEGRGPGGYSSAHPDASDPQLIGGLLADYVEERGWDRPLAEARVFSDWAALVGDDVAAHSTPTALANGELKVTAESTAWATQLRLLSGALLARLVAELGPQVVTSIRVSGPSGPSWKHGGFSVRGARGPRDTYG